MKNKNIYAIKDLITQDMRGEPFYAGSDVEAVREIQNMFIQAEKQGHKPRYREFDILCIGSIDGFILTGLDPRIVTNCAKLDEVVEQYLSKQGV